MEHNLNIIMPASLSSAVVRSQTMPFVFDGITMRNSEVSVVMVICRNKDISSSEISDRIGCTRSYISQVVSRLEKNGFIYRKQLSERKRFYGLYPTEKGIQLNRAFEEYVTFNNKFIVDNIRTQCTEEEIETFIKVGNVLGELMTDRMNSIYGKE